MITPKKQSIASKLLIAFLLISLSGAVLTAVFTYWMTVNQFNKLVYNQLQDRFMLTARLYYRLNHAWDGFWVYLRDLEAPAKGVLPPVIPQVGQPHTPKASGLVFLLADANGRVIVPANQFKPGDVLSTEELSQGIDLTLDGQMIGKVLAFGKIPPLGSVELTYLQGTNQAIIYATLIAAVIGLILGGILARSFTRPLRKLTDATQQIAAGNLNQHIAINSKDELGELAQSFNRMSQELARMTQSRRQMTADIAHDLRSPLSVISGYIEAMREGVLPPSAERLTTVNNEVQHLQRLVDDLRLLSQAEEGEIPLVLQKTDPCQLLQQILAGYALLAAQKQVNMQIDCAGNLPNITIDPDRMIQVLGNLVGNALKFTPAGGTISLSAWQAEQQICLAVKDSGAGIEAHILPHIFDRFYRHDSSRQGEGSGLGLAITRALVLLHKGTIRAYSDGVDQGATFIISLPVNL